MAVRSAGTGLGSGGECDRDMAEMLPWASWASPGWNSAKDRESDRRGETPWWSDVLRLLRRQTRPQTPSTTLSPADSSLVAQ